MKAQIQRMRCNLILDNLVVNLAIECRALYQQPLLPLQWDFDSGPIPARNRCSKSAHLSHKLGRILPDILRHILELIEKGEKFSLKPKFHEINFSIYFWHTFITL